MILASIHQKTCDLKGEPVFQLFPLMPVCCPKVALRIASQFLRTLSLWCLLLQISPAVCECCLATAMPRYQIKHILNGLILVSS